MFVEGLTKFAFYIFFYNHGGVEETAEAIYHLVKYIFLSKMEALIVKDGGSNYQRWRLQIVKNLATNPPFFLPC